MARTLKSKLGLGLGFLFVIILLLSGVGAYFLLQLARSSEVSLQDNYRSVAYSRYMADALADMREARPAGSQPASPAYAQARQTFTRYLAAEQNNITEPGERELVDSLATAFRQYEAAPGAEAAGYQQLRRHIARVATLNLQAIEKRSAATRRIANRTIGTLGLLAAVGILITLSFIFSFPDYLARPVEELTAGIRRVAGGDYAQRLPVRPNDEFAPVAQAFNELVNRLEGYETADGTPRLTAQGPLEVVTSHQRPGQASAAAAPADAEQRRLVEQLLQQSRQLQRTAELLQRGASAPGTS
ncbi:HAMP domain-containing protein [Hymenobacter weizhouensis]|uniref:HAMP domain-containing protein n=1 Tax=Hymenobacter sp. YIM 151500-1 TaxID=2987689 RepID=UPI002227A07B|nr:HAMP domain-containing protein [Hymenobacter sp. YIM 151500-1]UYZ64734.1 HAMP domain-containing protein [Hymenobacter sp. YIM 151500-1]